MQGGNISCCAIYRDKRTYFSVDSIFHASTERYVLLSLYIAQQLMLSKLAESSQEERDEAGVVKVNIPNGICKIDEILLDY